MSLYHLLRGGPNPYGACLLLMLGIGPEQIPRYRDVYVKDGHIVIYTRTGGGNREQYDAEDCEGPSNHTLRALPGYVRDEDDDFDSTYAYFWYSSPEQYKDEVSRIEQHEPRLDPSTFWEKLFADMKHGAVTPDMERAKEVGERMIQKIKDSTEGIFKI